MRVTNRGKHCGLSACRGAGARGFTLIEVSITIIIIAMLSGLVLVAANRAIRGARVEGERQLLVSLKQAISNFKNEFGFLPPLVDDAAGAVVGGQPRTRTGAELRGFTNAAGSGVINPEDRYSVNSLTFYLMGMCNFPGPGGKPVDGAEGSRFTAPREDGTFTQRGKGYDSMYDASSQVRRIGGGGTNVTFNDRWGSPIRYYRWESRPADASAAAGDPNSKVRTAVPRAAGDPRVNAKVRGARFALVSLGENRVTDNGPPIEVGNGTEPPVDAELAGDDIVEVEE